MSFLQNPWGALSHNRSFNFRNQRVLLIDIDSMVVQIRFQANVLLWGDRKVVSVSCLHSFAAATLVYLDHYL